jgi:hypothetical protein
MENLSNKMSQGGTGVEWDSGCIHNRTSRERLRYVADVEERATVFEIVWHKDKVGEMAARLQGFREQLDSRILVSLWHHVTRHLRADCATAEAYCVRNDRLSEPEAFLSSGFNGYCYGCGLRCCQRGG